MKFISAFVYLAVASAPFALAYVYLDITSFTFVDWLAIAWVSLLLIANIYFNLFSFLKIEVSKSEIKDNSGQVALAPAFLLGLLIYSIISIMLVAYGFSGDNAYLNSIQIRLYNWLLFVLFILYTWFIMAAGAIEKFQSKADVAGPSELALRLSKSIDILISNNAVSASSDIVKSLHFIVDKLKYHLNKSPIYLMSYEYKDLISDIDELIIHLSELSADNDNLVKSLIKKINAKL